jgi:hypothetical protein
MMPPAIAGGIVLFGGGALLASTLMPWRMRRIWTASTLAISGGFMT